MSVNIEPQENDVDDINMSQISIPDLPEVFFPFCKIGKFLIF